MENPSPSTRSGAKFHTSAIPDQRFVSIQLPGELRTPVQQLEENLSDWIQERFGDGGYETLRRAVASCENELDPLYLQLRHGDPRSRLPLLPQTEANGGPVRLLCKARYRVQTEPTSAVDTPNGDAPDADSIESFEILGRIAATYGIEDGISGLSDVQYFTDRSLATLSSEGDGPVQGHCEDHPISKIVDDFITEGDNVQVNIDDFRFDRFVKGRFEHKAEFNFYGDHLKPRTRKKGEMQHEVTEPDD